MGIEHRNTGDSSSFREAVDGGGRIHVPNPCEGVPKRAYRVLLDRRKRPDLVTDSSIIRDVMVTLGPAFS